MNIYEVFFDHHVEVGDGRTINRTTGARSHDAADLRNHTARERVAQKDIGVTTETDYTLLNARAARIVESDNRRANLHRQIHYLANLFRVSFRKGAAKNSEVLSKDKDVATIDQAMTGDHAVARIDLLVETEVFRAMHDELIELFKRAFVQQELNPFARSHLSRFVLLLYARSAAALLGLQLRSRKVSSFDFDCFRLLF